MRHVSLRVAFGLILLVGSASSFALAAQAAQPPTVRSTRAQQADPLELFRPMMPTLTSPRCFNCHGGTNPVTGENHGGGAVGPGAACGECHTESGDWRDVSGIAFDRQLQPMCEVMKHVVEVVGADGFVNFLGSDPVVGLGFEGLRGMDENSPFWPLDAEPPPTGRDAFVAAAQRWVTEGGADCTRHGWSGTIVQTTNLKSGSGAANEITTDVTLTINVDRGVATAAVHLVGKTIQEGQKVNGCQTYHHETFGVDRTVPAHVEIAVSEPMAMDDSPELPPLPPGIPDPRNGAYSITYGVSQTVPGVHHIEDQFVTNPPKFTCEQKVQDPPYAYAPTGGSILKGLEGGDAKHLMGSDTQTTDGSSVNTTWNLSLD